MSTSYAHKHAISYAHTLMQIICIPFVHKIIPGHSYGYTQVLSPTILRLDCKCKSNQNSSMPQLQNSSTNPQNTRSAYQHIIINNTAYLSTIFFDNINIQQPPGYYYYSKTLLMIAKHITGVGKVLTYCNLPPIYDLAL